MVTSPYGFLRGTAIVMAADVAQLPATGITPVVCGDAHLGNFGFYASPEGELVIDLNDFDEAHPGSWEWDLRRLVASIFVAGRENGASEEECHASVLACVAAYRDEVRFLAEQPLLLRSYNRLDVGRLHETATEKSLRDEIERSAKRARTRTSDRALPRFTAEHEGGRRIVEEPPLITRVSDEDAEAIAEGLDAYLSTLAPHWRRVLGGYTLVDIAHKVVGVGSVGLRAYVALLEGSSPDDVVFLQLKQARRSVLAQYVHGESAWHAHQGQRVVEYQQALQTVSDPLLGWTTIGGSAVLRAPVPQHEGHHRAGCDRRGGAHRLRGDRRSPACQGSRPNERSIDDRGLRRSVGQAGSGAGELCPCLRGPDRRLIMVSWWTLCAPDAYRLAKQFWSGRAQPSGRSRRRQRGRPGRQTITRPVATNAPATSSTTPPTTRPRVRVRSALRDCSSRSEAPSSGGRASPRMAGTVPEGTLPLHNVVTRRCTASSPLPSMPLTAKITHVLPILGSRPQAVASFGEATTCSLMDRTLVDSVNLEPDIGTSLGAPPDGLLSSTVPRNTAVDWCNARSTEMPAQLQAYALPAGATVAAKIPSRTAAMNPSSRTAGVVTMASLGRRAVEDKLGWPVPVLLAILAWARGCSPISIRGATRERESSANSGCEGVVGP